MDDDHDAPRLRIGELARRADVPRATIQFYVREQLLPAPLKTGRTMAYYDESCVERVKLIKELQRRYLPLSVIRPMLEAAESKAGRADVARATSRIQRALQPPAPAMTRAQVLEQTKVPPETLEGLERLGLVGGGERKCGAWDVAIIQAVAKVQASGITASAGFDVSDLALYRDAMSALLEKEVAAFSRSMLGPRRASRARRSPEDVVRLAIAAAVGATDLMVAIRGKLLDQLVASAGLDARRRTEGKRRGKRR